MKNLRKSMKAVGDEIGVILTRVMPSVLVPSTVRVVSERYQNRARQSALQIGRRIGFSPYQHP